MKIKKGGKRKIRKGTFIYGFIGTVILAAAFTSVSYGEEPAREYYASGKVNREATLKNGKPEGPVRAYYENGQLKSELVFENGHIKP